MRKLCQSLYITTPDVYVSLDGDNIVLLRERETIARRPLHNIENIVIFGYSGASPKLMGRCVSDGIGLCFLTPQGKFLARVSGEVHGNIYLRREQYRIADDEGKCIGYARNFIIGKIMNSRYVVERAIRDYPLRLDTDKFAKVSNNLMESVKNARECMKLDTLRGIEGEAASEYFSLFDDLILQQKDFFKFKSREKYPSVDPVNAMLSFAYTLLLHECVSALETVGIDPYAGFLHRDRPGRQSLACDLMEELRAVFCDRFVLTLINKRMISEKDILIKEDGVVLLEDEARNTFLKQWRERSLDEITHPYLNEKIPIGLIPYAQALLLARCIRGDIDGYPPFIQ